MAAIKRWLKDAFEALLMLIGIAAFIAFIGLLIWWDKVRFVL